MQRQKISKALELFSKRVIQQSRSNLTRTNKNASKGLYDSIKSNTKVSANSFEQSFEMADYGKFQDQGVKGAKSVYPSARNSPFKYSNKRPPASVSEKWFKLKGIKPRDKKTGKFITNRSLSFMIANSVYSKGIKGSLFFTRPFENEFKKLPDELIEAFGLDMEDFLNYTTKKQ